METPEERAEPIGIHSLGLNDSEFFHQLLAGSVAQKTQKAGFQCSGGPVVLVGLLKIIQVFLQEIGDCVEYVRKYHLH